MNLSDYEYFRTPNGILYLGDALTIMPLLEPVDLVLTDPPYGLNFNNGDLAHNWEKVFGGDFAKGSPAHIDHNHKTGVIRGVLCRNCNSALGLFQDDTEILEKAIRYLK